MTDMRLGSALVRVELTPNGWLATWPKARVTLGPATAEVEFGDGTVESGPRGRWTTEPGEAFGRAGTWARFSTGDDGVALAVHVPDAGSMLVVGSAHRPGRERRLRRIVPLEGRLDLGVPASEATRLQHGYQSWDYSGVRRASEDARSWWTAAYADPASGRGLAVQALGARRFATGMRTVAEAGTLRLVVECGATPRHERLEGTWGYRSPLTPLDLRIAVGEEARSETIAVAAGEDAQGTLEELSEFAAQLLGARRWDGGPITGWESWYHFGLAVTPADVIANARTLRERFSGRRGFRVVQVDDGWQRAYGDWRAADAWPSDMGTLAAELRDLGCVPGLWLAPFMVEPGSGDGARGHPEWLVRHPSTEAPLADGLTMRWGIDASHPAALAWLAGLGARVREWGFGMVKLDFLYIGALEGRRHDDRITGTEALRRGLEAFLRGLGDDVYVLGCGMPILPAVGICHGNRIGGDVAAPVLAKSSDPARSWYPFRGIRAEARNAAARAFLHRRFFHNDPDVVLAYGDESSGYSLEEARTLATLAALCGGPFLLADDLAALSPIRRAVIENAELLDLVWGDGFRPLDPFAFADETEPVHFFAETRNLPSIWTATRDGRRVVALFNWSEEPADREAPEDIALARELWTGTALSREEERITLVVPPHGVRLLVD